MRLTPEERAPGRWDYDGHADPAHGKRWDYIRAETFSVGCFQWVAKASGKGLKRSRAHVRFRGRVDEPEKVYEQARRFCERMESAS